MSDPGDLSVFLAVLAARFALPLLIPKFPLPAIIGCLVLDGVDKGIFAALTDLDLSGYQGYDKALDIFYLTIAMLTVLRNWSSIDAARIARFLFYFRLVGVVAFEYGDWRPALLLFPNTFEYFFICYELIRTRWAAEHINRRRWLIIAAAIWVGIKLPQEYWIHIAKLDATEAMGDHPLVVAAGIAVAAAVALTVRLRRGYLIPRAQHPLSLAADPLPAGIDEAHERAAWMADRWRLFDTNLLEKVLLVGLVTAIFASIMPGVDARPLQLTIGVFVIAAFNAAVRLRYARTGRAWQSAASAFALFAAVNTLFALAADWLLHRGDGDLDAGPALFFLLLLTLIVTLYDHWRPIHEYRVHHATSTATGTGTGPAAASTDQS